MKAVCRPRSSYTGRERSPTACFAYNKEGVDLNGFVVIPRDGDKNTALQINGTARHRQEHRRNGDTAFVYLGSRELAGPGAGLPSWRAVGLSP